MVKKLEFSKLMDPRDNRLPKKTGLGGKIKPLKTQRLFNPKIMRNPKMARELDQFRPANRQVIRAANMKALNRSVDTINRHLAKFKNTKGVFFELDKDSNKYFAVIKDKQTGAVLKQIPGDGVIQLAANLRDASGMITSVTG